MVHVTINDNETINCYHESLYDIYDKEVLWVLKGEVPSLDGLSLKHAVDAVVLPSTSVRFAWSVFAGLSVSMDRAVMNCSIRQQHW